MPFNPHHSYGIYRPNNCNKCNADLEIPNIVKDGTVWNLESYAKVYGWIYVRLLNILFCPDCKN